MLITLGAKALPQTRSAVTTDHQAVYETRDREVETGQDPGGGHYLQELAEEVTASDVETGQDPGARHFQQELVEEVTASDVETGPDPGAVVLPLRQEQVGKSHSI